MNEHDEAIRAAWEREKGRALPWSWQPSRFDVAIYRAGLIAGMRMAADEVNDARDRGVILVNAVRIEQEQP